MISTKELKEEFNLLLSAYKGDVGRAVPRFLIRFFDAFEELVEEGEEPIKALQHLSKIWASLASTIRVRGKPVLKIEGWPEYIRVRLPDIYEAMISVDEGSDNGKAGAGADNGPHREKW